MAITDALLPEFDHEMATTRRLLDRVPEAQFAWKPHDKSMTLGQLAGHLANIPYWCSATLSAPVLDLDTLPGRRTSEGAGHRATRCSRSSIKRSRQRAQSSPRRPIRSCLSPWTLKKGDQEFFTMPCIAAIRSFVMNHSIHHRGQLSVYLRLNDVPIPPIYGPTADEQF